MNIKDGVNLMTLNTILTMLKVLIDISLVWVLVYTVLKNLKNKKIPSESFGFSYLYNRVIPTKEESLQKMQHKLFA